MVKEGVERIKEIIDYGAQFDKDASGEYALGREGGHSEHRILHHKDITAVKWKALLEQLYQCKNKLINHCFVVDLITQHHLGYLVTKSTTNITCYGVYVLNLQATRLKDYFKITLLATGGNGQAYRTTTNPKIATGDGVAMAYRAKEELKIWSSSNFIQQALYEPEHLHRF